MDSIGAADEVIHEHNYSFRADDSRNATTCTALPLSHQSIEDAAGDPELENLEYISTGVPSVPSTTPGAAWVPDLYSPQFCCCLYSRKVIVPTSSVKLLLT